VIKYTREFSVIIQKNEIFLMILSYPALFMLLIQVRCEASKAADIAVNFKAFATKQNEELLSKALGQLLSNAAKFTDSGSITFGFTIEEHGLDFFVNDQGKGITEDKLESIFEAFEPENTAMTRGHEGSGPGLAITKGIVQLLGGEMRATSVKLCHPIITMETVRTPAVRQGRVVNQFG
jgi:signal transduction histidine kinase